MTRLGGQGLGRVLRVLRLAAVAAVVCAGPGLAQTARIALRWGTVSDAVAYELQIGRDSSFNEVVLQTRTTDPAYRWEKPPAATHWWRVRSLDKDQRASEWSEARAISVEGGIPELKAPEEGAKVVCGAPVRFEANASGLVQELVLELSQRADFSDARELRDREGRFGVPSLESGTWHWRVLAVDLQGRRSERSPPRTLDVRTAVPKTKASGDLAPGATGLLSWGVPACATSYVVEVSSDFGERLVLPAAQPQLAFKPQGVGEYRWRVAALDKALRQGEWSTERRFRAAFPKPGGPREATRKNGVELAWDAVQGAASYRVELARAGDVAFAKPTHVANVQGTSWRSPPLDVGSYLWRVSARDAGGRGQDATVARSVTFSPGSGLDVPAWELPAEGAVREAGTSVALTWSPVEDAARYELELDGKPLMTTEEARAVAAGLAEGEHRVRVRAVAAVKGRTSQWSAWRTFFVGVPPVASVAVEAMSETLEVRLFDARGRAILGHTPSFEFRDGALLRVVQEGEIYTLWWRPPPSGADTLVVTDRGAVVESPVAAPRHMVAEVAVQGGFILSGRAVASPSWVGALTVPLPVLERRLFLQARGALYGATARLIIDGRPDAAAMTAVPLSLHVGWRFREGPYELRAGAGPGLQILAFSVGADRELRLVPSVEGAIALSRRLGDGALHLELSGLYGRADTRIAHVDAGGIAVRIGYALALPVEGR